uniref:EGF-like-domain, multiple 7 n=1 Tax=Poecilia reticulata TaxID=8081 RepID=A0A3P9QAG8_POERE
MYQELLLSSALLFLHVMSTPQFFGHHGRRACSGDLRHNVILATESYAQPVHKPYITLCQGHRLCSTYKTTYSLAYRQVSRIESASHFYPDCCPGWRRFHSHNCNQALCAEPCANGGTCLKPNKCACTPGWTAHRCQTGTQKSHSDSPEELYVNPYAYSRLAFFPLFIPFFLAVRCGRVRRAAAVLPAVREHSWKLQMLLQRWLHARRRRTVLFPASTSAAVSDTHPGQPGSSGWPRRCGRKLGPGGERHRGGPEPEEQSGAAGEEATAGVGALQQLLPAAAGRQLPGEDHPTVPLLPAAGPHRLPQRADRLPGGAPRHMLLSRELADKKKVVRSHLRAFITSPAHLCG